jgi:hypothetical protein
LLEFIGILKDKLSDWGNQGNLSLEPLFAAKSKLPNSGGEQYFKLPSPSGEGGREATG